MKILFLSRLFYPHIGGVEKHVLEVGKRLVAQKNSVIVITEAYNQHNQSESESAKVTGSIFGITIYRMHVGSNMFLKKFFIWFWLLKHQNLIRQADIIHAHDVFFWYLPFRFLYPQKKVFTTFHGYEGNNMPNFRSIAMHKIAEKLSWGNICVGEFLTKWYGTKPTYITYGAISPEVRKVTTNVMPEKGKTYHVTFVGRLEEETGIIVYLWAVLLLKEKGYRVSLTVCGDGSQRQRCEDFMRNYDVSVTFVGFVKDVLPYIEKSDFVFVSRYLGILESLEKKKPVFALYNNLIKKDYLSMTPFAKSIIICENENDVVHAFIKLVHEKKQRAIKVETGYAWAKKQTWENLVNTYKNLWQK